MPEPQSMSNTAGPDVAPSVNTRAARRAVARLATCGLVASRRNKAAAFGDESTAAGGNVVRGMRTHRERREFAKLPRCAQDGVAGN
jgi:hypothetical protein